MLLAHSRTLICIILVERTSVAKDHHSFVFSWLFLILLNMYCLPFPDTVVVPLLLGWCDSAASVDTCF